jgi:hypothetical protein
MPSVSAAAPMDREFIERNQIVERYLSGRLPVRGAADFERFCREHPEMLDGIGLAARVNAGLKLLESGGQPEPWTQPKPQPWQKPPVLIGAAASAFVLLIVTGVLWSKLADRNASIVSLQRRVAEQPLEPMTSTHTIKLIPSRAGPVPAPMAYVGGGGSAELADLKIDLSWTRMLLFRVTIDRDTQGRIAVLQQLAKDSNGDLRIAFNSSALGPGVYRFTIEGLDWRGQPQPTAWISLGINH